MLRKLQFSRSSLEPASRVPLNGRTNLIRLALILMLINSKNLISSLSLPRKAIISLEALKSSDANAKRQPKHERNETNVYIQ